MSSSSPTRVGMMGAMIRHMNSLRYMERDHGWIHTLLEEAENERMHLLTFLELRRPGPLFKAMVICSQGKLLRYYHFSERNNLPVLIAHI